jgi:hypothetical protein
MRSQIEMQARQFGYTDMTSRGAQIVALGAARRMGMDDAAAGIYVKSEFTAEGRAAAERAIMDTKRAAMMADAKNADDIMQSRRSFMGRSRAALQGAEGVVSGFLSNQITSIESFGSEGRQRRAIEAGLNGLAPTELSAADFLEINDGPAAPSKSMARYRNPSRSLLGSTALLGSGVAAGIGAAALMSNPFGWAALGVGALVGATVGFGAAPLSDYAFGWGDSVYTDKTDIAGMSGLSTMLSRSDAGRGRSMVGRMRGAEWASLMKGPANQMSMTSEELLDRSRQIKAVAKASGVSEQDVVNALGAAGVQMKAPDLIEGGGLEAGATKHQIGLMNDVLNGRYFNGTIDATGSNANLSDPATARAIANYARYVKSGQGDIGAIQADLASTIGGGKILDQFKTNVGDLSAGELDDLIEGAGKTRSQAVGAERKRRMKIQADTALQMLDRRNLSDSDRVTARGLLEKVSSGDADMIKMLGDPTGEFTKLAKQGAFGSQIQDVATVASADELSKMSAEQIQQMYHLGEANIGKIKELKGRSPQDLRERIQQMKAASIGIGANQETDAAREAALLKETASTLERLNKALDHK